MLNLDSFLQALDKQSEYCYIWFEDSLRITECIGWHSCGGERLNMKKPLALRFAVLYLLLGVLPLVLASAVFLQATASLSTEDAKELYGAELRQIAYYSENHLHELENAILRYVTNNRFISYLSPGRKYATYADSVDAYLTFLRPLITTEFLNGSVKRHLKVYYHNPNLIQGYNVFVYADEAVRAREEYRRAVEEAASGTAWYFDAQTNTLYASQAIRDSGGNIYGVFSVSESAQLLNELFQGLNAETASLFLLDETGTVVASNHMQLVGTSASGVLSANVPAKGGYAQMEYTGGLQFQRAEEESVLSAEEPLLIMGYQLSERLPDWRIALCIPNSKLRSHHDSMVMLALYASMGLGLMSAAVILLVTNRQIGRLKPLLTAMRAAAPLTAFNYHPPAQQDELDEIMVAYNGLMQRITQLIQENYLMRLTQKEAELHALQTQVNPHFIYNLLEQVHMRLILAGDQESARMILLFSRLIRRTMHQKEALTSLREEVEFLQYYLELQRMRYNHRISYEIDVPEALMDCYLPRFTLEPLVENSFKHGFTSMADTGQISLRAEQVGEDVEITIRDTSNAPTAETSAQVMAKLTEDPLDSVARIGIFNVHARLRMRYGPAYGVCRVEPSDQERGSGWLLVIKVPVDTNAPLGGEKRDLSGDC